MYRYTTKERAFGAAFNGNSHLKDVGRDIQSWKKERDKCIRTANALIEKLESTKRQIVQITLERSQEGVDISSCDQKLQELKHQIDLDIETFQKVHSGLNDLLNQQKELQEAITTIEREAIPKDTKPMLADEDRRSSPSISVK